MLPAKFAVRDYLKRQERKLATLNDHSLDEMLVRWSQSYRSHQVGSEKLKAYAEEYAECLRQVGSFSIIGDYRSGTRVSPHRERSYLSGFVLEPCSLGQGWSGGNSDPYVENAALLNFYTAEFRRKKAYIGIGPSGIVLTQHLLERVYERTEVELSALASLIERETTDLLRALALVQCGSMWLEYLGPDGVSRVTAVPFSNGLMIANERYLHPRPDEYDLGIRTELPSGRTLEPFANGARIVREVNGRGHLPAGACPLIMICGVTYVNSVTLSDVEADYYYSFKSLMDASDPGVLDALAHLQFAPTLPHEKIDRFIPAERLEPKFDRLKGILRSGWLKTNPSHPLCVLLPYDHEMPRSRREP